MLGRGVGEAKRKIVLLTLLVLCLVITFVAFRPQDRIKYYLDYGHQSSNSTEQDKTPELNRTRPKSKPVSHKGPVLGNGERSLAASSLSDIANSTLGFGNVYVLNVPGRTDKLDAMKLASSLSGFEFELIKGIDGADVPIKALSGDWGDGDGDGKKNNHAVIGCWRGHVNFASTIVDKRLSSALIMEDDADWDVSFRSQLELVALGSQTLLDTPTGSVPNSPYGDGWDMLWLGHCASDVSDGDRRRFLMKNDPTVTPFQHRVNFGDVPDMSPYDNTTRIMYYTKGSTCTYSYALSFHGAQKILKWLSMDIYSGPVDFGLRRMCSERERNFTCLGIFPQIVGDHKPAGSGIRDSDIAKGETQVRERGFTYNIVHSTRVNANALVDGHLNQVKSQWPDDDPVITEALVTEYVDGHSPGKAE